MSRLKNLLVQNNYLTTLPYLPPNVVQVLLSFNSISTIPIQLLNSPTVAILSLKGNGITVLPTNMFSLYFPLLVQLSIANNPNIILSSDSGTGMSNLQRLSNLDISSINLNTIPVWLTTITTLRTLTCNSNNIQSLPTSFSNLNKITSLSINSNLFTAYPTALSAFISLTYLDVSYNALQV